MLKKHNNIILVFLLVLVVISCKKYPENNLILKKPIKAIHGEWKLIAFIVNGTDSTGYSNMNVYTENKFDFWKGETQGTFGARDKFGPVLLSNQSGVTYMSGSWSLKDNDKSISMYLEPINGGYYIYYPGSNPIFTSGSWKIEKLSRKEFWMSRESTGNKYEAHFKR